MTKRRTPEELNALDQAKIARRRVMLARARDPRIEILEDAVRALEACRAHVDFGDTQPGIVQHKILEVRDRLVAEAAP